MHAAVLHAFGEPPRHGPFAEPEPAPGAVVVDVKAAGLHHLDLLKTSGRFYMAPPPLPSAVGTDGVGLLDDGRRVYFDEVVAPFGSMAEHALAKEEALFEIAEDLDDVTAAALGNTGLGAWLALDWRSGLQEGDTVLVLGAGGAVGTVAVQAAKLLGAGRVVAAGRAGERLQRQLERGADAVVALDEEDDLAEAFRRAAGGGLDVVIDTLWGEPAQAAIQAASRRCRHVQVGQLAGLDITLPAPAVRSVSLDLRGFGRPSPAGGPPRRLSGAHPPRRERRHRDRPRGPAARAGRDRLGAPAEGRGRRKARAGSLTAQPRVGKVPGSQRERSPH